MRVGSCALLILLFAAAASAQTRDGRELYLAACAACHAPDGRGQPQTTVGFETPLPDFTDCSFATPEADADWFSIIHQGGPVRAFDRRMPSFGEALKEDEIFLILNYIRGFCGDRRWPRGELNLPRPLVTEKAFPENETLLTIGARSGQGRVTNGLLYEQRIGARSQFEMMVPLVAQETTEGWHSGLGDLAVAFKHVLAHSLERGRIFSAAAEVVLPTGSETSGLGGGVTVVEPFVAFGQILPADAFLQVQTGAEITSSGEHEGFWRVAFGRTLFQQRFGRAWSPMIELLGDREIERGEPFHWDVAPQLQVSLSRRQHILVSGGVRVPVVNRTGRPTQVLGYFLWDWFDGGLLDGWK